jgi:hypothetical protein
MIAAPIKIACCIVMAVYASACPADARQWTLIIVLDTQVLKAQKGANQ